MSNYRALLSILHRPYWHNNILHIQTAVNLHNFMSNLAFLTQFPNYEQWILFRGIKSNEIDNGKRSVLAWDVASDLKTNHHGSVGFAIYRYRNKTIDINRLMEISTSNAQFADLHYVNEFVQLTLCLKWVSFTTDVLLVHKQRCLWPISLYQFRL